MSRERKTEKVDSMFIGSGSSQQLIQRTCAAAPKDS